MAFKIFSTFIGVYWGIVSGFRIVNDEDNDYIPVVNVIIIIKFAIIGGIIGFNLSKIM